MFKQIIEKIKQYETIIIHTHVRPDGDCNGSAFGLKNIILENFDNKKVYVVGENLDFIKFIGTVDTIADTVYQNALVIVVDTAVSARIADQRYTKGDYLIKIDHHIAIEKYGDISYVDTSRPACSQIIAEMALQNNLKLNEAAMTALFTGILTDTGRFRFRSVGHHTFDVASEFMKRGLNHEQIFNHLSVVSENLLRFKGYFFQNYKKTENGVAYIKITQNVINKFNISDGEASSLVNELSVFEDCPIWALFIEDSNQKIRGRLRSKGPTIDHIANKYNGGGHALACGVTLENWDQSNDVLTELDELAIKYKSQI